MQETNENSLQRIRYVKKMESGKTAKDTNKLSTVRRNRRWIPKECWSGNLKENIERHGLIEGEAEDRG